MPDLLADALPEVTREMKKRWLKSQAAACKSVMARPNCWQSGKAYEAVHRLRILEAILEDYRDDRDQS